MEKDKVLTIDADKFLKVVNNGRQLTNVPIKK